MKKLLFANLLAIAVVVVTADAVFGIMAPRGEAIAVPDYTGKNETEAESDGRFEVTAVYRYADEPAGTVLGQTPEAGAPRRTGGRRIPMKITVSMGPETVTVPDLRGENARVAAAKLRERGLAVERIPTAEPGAAGTVADMDPKPGTGLRKGSKVRLTVAGEIPENDPEQV